MARGRLCASYSTIIQAGRKSSRRRPGEGGRRPGEVVEVGSRAVQPRGGRDDRVPREQQAVHEQMSKYVRRSIEVINLCRPIFRPHALAMALAEPTMDLQSLEQTLASSADTSASDAVGLRGEVACMDPDIHLGDMEAEQLDRADQIRNAQLLGHRTNLELKPARQSTLGFALHSWRRADLR